MYICGRSKLKKNDPKRCLVRAKALMSSPLDLINSPIHDHHPDPLLQDKVDIHKGLNGAADLMVGSYGSHFTAIAEKT